MCVVVVFVRWLCWLLLVLAIFRVAIKIRGVRDEESGLLCRGGGRVARFTQIRSPFRFSSGFRAQCRDASSRDYLKMARVIRAVAAFSVVPWSRGGVAASPRNSNDSCLRARARLESNRLGLTQPARLGAVEQTVLVCVVFATRIRGTRENRRQEKAADGRLLRRTKPCSTIARVIVRREWAALRCCVLLQTEAAYPCFYTGKCTTVIRLRSRLEGFSVCCEIETAVVRATFAWNLFARVMFS